MKQSIQNHYQTLADNYDQFWGISPEFIKFITQKIIESLNLVPDDVLVDLGCGTGLYSKEIISQIPLNNPILCVDPSGKMLSKIPKSSQYKVIEKDALAFCDELEQYNKILIKEMIHHITDKEKLLHGLLKGLNSGGVLLIILLPPTIEYPLFTKALRTYEALQPHYDDLVTLLQKIGFETTVNFVDYPVSIAKETYFKMVENRYMSLLSQFDDEELQEGLREMEGKYHQYSQLEFCDRFVFIISQVQS
ncbi:class I SAM-dependent methyltransferase [Crocosphaera sp. Alani8]|uniref:class I SAM-dependent methyltransferase n=1 Tax=Crocosphaera sp. Alani8 TaxID=3038952 RepID=UPI00313BE36F